MLTLLSPAKKLDFSPAPHPRASRPVLMEETAKLATTARRLSKAKIKAMMSLSDDLAKLNHERFQAFDADKNDQGFPAALAFAGDVYRGLDARSLPGEDLLWAQDHLRMLSGLYGVLRPLDAIQPYRLEMGTKLHTRRGETLYDFWGARIAKALKADLESHDERAVVNLASDEYFKAVDVKALGAPVVSFKFQDVKDGKARSLFLYVKLARGMMARWMIDNRIDCVEGLKDFNVEGYKFEPGDSSGDVWVYKRKQPPAKKAA
ncbi:MAG: peroxide stress protein YaaA [Maricaulaceae bacterium]|jgi:hypothetical protein